MDDLCVVSKRKYKHMRRAVIVMPIIAAVLTTAVLWWICGAYRELTADFVPREGIWFCEELGLTADFDSEPQDILTDADGTRYLVFCHNPTRSMRVCTIADSIAIVEAGKVKYEYKAGEDVYFFRATRLTGKRYTVQDENENKYVFVRK